MLDEMKKVKKAVNTAKPILKKEVFDHKDPYLALLDWRNTPTKELTSTEADGTENKDSPPNFSKIAETQATKGLVTKKREKQAHYYKKGAKQLNELKPGDIARMRPDPKDRKSCGMSPRSCAKILRS